MKENASTAVVLSFFFLTKMKANKLVQKSYAHSNIIKNNLSAPCNTKK